MEKTDSSKFSGIGDIAGLARKLLRDTVDVRTDNDFKDIKKIIKDAYSDDKPKEDRHGIHKVGHAIDTAVALCEMVSPDRNMIIATLVYGLCVDSQLSLEKVKTLWGDDVERMVNGLLEGFNPL